MRVLFQGVITVALILLGLYALIYVSALFLGGIVLLGGHLAI